jgi:catechol 2,3-dioxygenase-like lactoylglutathione lyase family enzyme
MRLEVVVLPVSDVDRARDFYLALGWRPGAGFAVDEGFRVDLASHGAGVSEVFHDATGVFHHAGTQARVPGPAAERATYGSWASFSDPDGNSWFVQEVTTRLPGRATSALASFDSVTGLAAALRRAAAAHGKHEEEIGHADPDWPDWYAQYMADESAGQAAGA